jgi:hypothetical protein
LHALDELAAEGIEFVFNTPNDQSRPGYLKMGWQVVGQLPTAVRPTRLTRIARIAKARVPAERWSTPSTAGIAVTEALADTDAVGSLLARRAPGVGLASRLSPAFLHWRFATPLLGYRAIPAPSGVQDGLAIFRLRARGSAREAALVSLLIPAGDRRTAAGLVKAVASQAEADYVLALGGPIRWPGGLVRLPRVGPVFTCRPVGVTAVPPRWDLSLGDIELF